MREHAGEFDEEKQKKQKQEEVKPNACTISVQLKVPVLAHCDIHMSIAQPSIRAGRHGGRREGGCDGSWSKTLNWYTSLTRVTFVCHVNNSVDHVE
jgi:hypothetical protein